MFARTVIYDARSNLQRAWQNRRKTYVPRPRHMENTKRLQKGMAAIRTGLEHGINHVDTAEMYANEELVGKAVSNYDVFIATKVSPNHFRHDDLIRACRVSISRLNVKQIDLYQLHWPNKRVPIKETIRAMEELVGRGLIRYIGVSNFSVSEMIEAQEAMKREEIVSN